MWTAKTAPGPDAFSINAWTTLDLPENSSAFIQAGPSTEMTWNVA